MLLFFDVFMQFISAYFQWYLSIIIVQYILPVSTLPYNASLEKNIF